MKRHQLVIAGTGIKFLSHMTIEVMEYIKQSDKLLFLVNEPAMADWIVHTNPKAEPLENIYFQHEDRTMAYNAISMKIILELEQHPLVCVLFYGHPGIYCEPGIQAARLARARGHDVMTLPGISAFDCMAADLGIDLCKTGLSFFEATHVLQNDNVLPIHQHVIVWQPAVAGILNIIREKTDNHANLERLMHCLMQFYPDSHPLTFYTASQYPHIAPLIQTVALDELNKTSIHALSSLYIPPLS